LLSQSDERLEYIASKCGFCDVARFEEAFEQIAGVSPKQYRKTRREEALEEEREQDQ
jgi:transcriptional regulator GlxA family with amidase domain